MLTYLNVLLSADGEGDVSSTCQVLEACMPGRYIIWRKLNISIHHIPGSHYSCSVGGCQLCGRGSYQPSWSQPRCWPCPAHSHTDTAGATSLGQCKQRGCGSREIAHTQVT